MQDKKALAAAALLGALALASTPAVASAPAGVWVKVREVVYAPDATNPTRVQIHGALMLFEGNLDGGQPYPGYTSPAFGYMYYECPAGQAEVCRQEWRDLEANIAKPVNECLGFGMQNLPTGTLRQLPSAAANPDVYPIQSGVSPGYSPCQAIAKFMAEQGAGGGGGVPSGGASTGGASTGGTGSSTGGTGSSTGGAGSSTGGKPASNGGAATTDAGTGSTGEEPTSGASTAAAGTGTGGRPGSEPDHLDAGKSATDGAADSKAAGCSITSAAGAASVLGLGAGLCIFGLALARRHRQRK